MNSFLNYLKSADPATYKALSQYKPGSSGFDGAWKSIASHSAQKFDQLQHGFIKQTHYDPAATSIKNTLGLDVNAYSPALQNVIWSMATQHGSAGAQKVAKNAGVKMGMSEADIIKRLYAERSKVDKYFSKSGADIKDSVKRRFQSELSDALAMLNKYYG